MTTIARVAQEAGVGVGTVSRVINGSASVSEATRRRVLDVVAELGYEPNATARALSTGRTRSVGVIAPFFTRSSVIERLRGVAPMLAASRLPAGALRRGAPGAARRRLPLGDRPRRRPALDLARPLHGRPAPARRRGHPRRARRPGARCAAHRHGRRRRGRPAGHEPPARARPPPDRVRRRHGRRRARRVGQLAPLRRLPARARRGRRAGPLRLSSSCARTGARPPRSRATCWSWPRRRRRCSPPPTCRRSP